MPSRYSSQNRLALPLVVFVLSALLGAGQVSAQDRGYSRSGPYVGAGATWVSGLFEDEVGNFASDLAGTPIAVDIQDTWGLNAVVGYRLIPILAVEAQYEYVDKFGIDATGLGVASNLQLEGHVVTGNLKLLLPTWRVQPYVLVGAGVVWYSVSGGVTGLGQALIKDDRAFAGRVGAGLDLYVTESWLLNVGASAVLSTEKVSSSVGASDLKGLHYVGAGASVQYRF